MSDQEHSDLRADLTRNTKAVRRSNLSQWALVVTLLVGLYQLMGYTFRAKDTLDTLTAMPPKVNEIGGKIDLINTTLSEHGKQIGTLNQKIDRVGQRTSNLVEKLGAERDNDQKRTESGR